MLGTTDILGHGAAVGRLWDAVRRDALHHAYLFEGPEGVGKHLVARRLAMACNCEQPALELPCGECASCRSIARDDFADVLTVGPHPDRKTPIITVDQIREVVRQVGYHRYTGKRRVVIVDPAEAMAAPASNALLKTLEEPPEGTGFVLIAHSASALLPTIVSRCQRVRFAAVPDDDVTAWLEARGVADAQVLARLAMGRPGAALALADGGLEARTTLANSVIGTIEKGDLGQIFALSKDLCTGDRQAWVPRVQQVFELLEDRLRDATIIGAGESLAVLDPAARHASERWAGALWPTGIARLVAALEHARDQLAFNATGRVVMDALLTRFATELGRS